MQAVAPKPVRRVPRYVPQYKPPCNHARIESLPPATDGQNAITWRACRDCGFAYQSVAVAMGAQWP